MYIHAGFVSCFLLVLNLTLSFHSTLLYIRLSFSSLLLSLIRSFFLLFSPLYLHTFISSTFLLFYQFSFRIFDLYHCFYIFPFVLTSFPYFILSVRIFLYFIPFTYTLPFHSIFILFLFLPFAFVLSILMPHTVLSATPFPSFIHSLAYVTIFPYHCPQLSHVLFS